MYPNEADFFTLDSSDECDNRILGWWYHPKEGTLVFCDGSTHTCSAVYDLKVSEEPDHCQDGVPDLEDDDAIEAAIRRGWVRVRYDYGTRSLFVHGTPRGCLKAAQAFAFSGRVAVETVTFDHVGPARHRGGILTGEGLELYLETGNTMLAAAAKEEAAFEMSAVEEPPRPLGP